jgi:hypothetical protein
MPLKKNWIGTAAAALAVLAVSPGSALASTAPTGCPNVTATNVFSGFGDTALYSLAPNGTFLNHASGWTFTGSASVVPDNEPFHLPGWAGANAIELGPNSTATSPTFCVSGNNPYFRALPAGPERGPVRDARQLREPERARGSVGRRGTEPAVEAAPARARRHGEYPP